MEKTGKPVTITRCGKVVVRLSPTGPAAGSSSLEPWEQLRMLGGRLLATHDATIRRSRAAKLWKP